MRYEGSRLDAGDSTTGKFRTLERKLRTDRKDALSPEPHPERLPAGFAVVDSVR
jgi:hypothetical protein